ncbi:class F sortase [Streptomyces xanthochromogenes]|uniref:Class F sortase n=1 Tax=Streptomyces xanthochromogenes TaxID=67384 RepID=A0ABQ3ALX4_9ACTN|nr:MULTISPECIES: class F sortase [Streptomyces]MYV92711.1 class F sortase [Streptomyces sp. SID1034]GGY58816.1 class F sortase [Streptomyces xanthochromogenes]GHB74897.1 class F sortase [Streptomyces xanthochromogenes]
MAQDEYGMERRRYSPWGALALVMLTGLALLRNGADVTMGPPQPAAAAALTSTAGTASPPPSAAVEPLPFAPASRVRIESINVNAPVMDVGTDPQGWVQAPPPEDPNLAGWYQNGVAPGMRGTSVVVGHVDNMKGPAVFYGLGSLQKGSHIEVDRFDGRTAVFEVYGVEVFDKATFPGARVYGDTGHPELRVITCGGGFSRSRGYDGNVVAFARLVSVK